MSDRLPSLVIDPSVQADIYGDARDALTFLLHGYYRDIVARNDSWAGRVKFELLYIHQELVHERLLLPLYVHGGYRPTSLRNAHTDGLHLNASPEATALETVLKCLDYGCRLATRQRTGAIVAVYDWFTQKFMEAGPVLPDSPEERLIDDLRTLRRQVAVGEVLPPVDPKQYAGLDFGMRAGLRSSVSKGGNALIGEGYCKLSDCVPRRFIPLMPYDIQGNRNIFIYLSIGAFDPLNPAGNLRKLEHT